MYLWADKKNNIISTRFGLYLISPMNVAQPFINKRPLLTIAFGSILQTKSDGQHGIIFKKLCSESIPPQVITLLQGGNSTDVRTDMQSAVLLRMC